MQAVLLVGGQGTRLRPLTLTTPKPMLPVAGVPFLEHQISRLVAAGVDHVVLATSYRADVFASYFGDGSSVGVRLTYVTETVPLGTGGAIRNAAAALEPSDAPFLVLNGDVVSGHDIAAQIALHCSDPSTVATLHLVRVADPRAFGCVPTDGDGRVLAFHEKMPEPVSDQINAGCYVLDRSVLDLIPVDTVVSVERETFPSLLASGALMRGFVADSYWLDVGTPAAYVQASADIVRGFTPDRQVDPSADVAPDAMVSGGASLGPGVRVESGAIVRGSVVQHGARIGAGATVVDSAVGADAVIGPGALVFDAVVGDGAVIEAGNELRAGARVWPGVVLPATAVRFSSDV